MTLLRFDARPAYELVLSLVAYATRQRIDSYAAGAAWFSDVDERAGADLRGRIQALTSGCDHVLTRLLGIAMDLPPPGSARQLVERVATMPAGELRLTLLGYYGRRARRRVATETFEAAAHGDRVAARSLIEGLADGPECERALAAALALTDEEAAELLVGVLEDWVERVFEHHHATVGALIEHESDRLRVLAARRPLHAFLDEVTHGADVITGPGINAIEVFPTWVLRPWNVFWEQGDSLLLGVPVPEDRLAVDPDAPPERLVEMTKALGDERRLRLLRRLTTGSYTLHELADHFGTPKTTLLHHLVILRSAGFVRVESSANGRYSLQTGAPLELNRLLDRYLPIDRREPLPAGVTARRSRTG